MNIDEAVLKAKQEVKYLRMNLISRNSDMNVGSQPE